MLSCLALMGCGERLRDIDPRPGFANLFGAHLEGREPPPGLDRPWPRLSSVPERPTPPDPATRERISAGLADDRQSSRAPVTARGGAPLSPPLAPAESGPPPRPRLAAVPRVAPDPAPAPGAASAPRAAPGVAALPADPVAPPPAPGRDLFAPPPPPGADLLAPRRD